MTSIPEDNYLVLSIADRIQYEQELKAKNIERERLKKETKEGLDEQVRERERARIEEIRIHEQYALKIKEQTERIKKEEVLTQRKATLKIQRLNAQSQAIVNERRRLKKEIAQREKEEAKKSIAELQEAIKKEKLLKAKKIQAEKQAYGKIFDDNKKQKELQAIIQREEAERDKQSLIEYFARMEREDKARKENLMRIKAKSLRNDKQQKLLLEEEEYQENLDNEANKECFSIGKSNQKSPKETRKLCKEFQTDLSKQVEEKKRLAEAARIRDKLLEKSSNEEYAKHIEQERRKKEIYRKKQNEYNEALKKEMLAKQEVKLKDKQATQMTPAEVIINKPLVSKVKAMNKDPEILVELNKTQKHLTRPKMKVRKNFYH